jgi:hypothetical protein
LVAAFVAVGLGLLFLANGFNRPTIANMRTVTSCISSGRGYAWAWA